MVIPAIIVTVVAASLVLSWRNSRSKGITGIEAFWRTAKTFFLVLALCSLCSKAIVHTYRHFNPPPPPIIGP